MGLLDFLKKGNKPKHCVKIEIHEYVDSKEVFTKEEINRAPMIEETQTILPAHKTLQVEPILEDTHADQRTATQEIIASTPFAAPAIEELDRIARERSDCLFQEREERVARFNPYDVEPNPAGDIQLNSVEAAFLKQMDKQDAHAPLVYAYWTYEYSLNYATTMTKFLENQYLSIANQYASLPHLTVAELKAILRHYGCKSGGLKSELIQRIRETVSDETFCNDFPRNKRYFSLTEKGIRVTSKLVKSATKNLELEDACIAYIVADNCNEAYKLVCKNELQKVIPRGIGLDWAVEVRCGLSSYDKQSYGDFLQADLRRFQVNISPAIYSASLECRASVILCLMLGLGADLATHLFLRISGLGSQYKTESTVLIRIMQFALLEARQKHCFELLRS